MKRRTFLKFSAVCALPNAVTATQNDTKSKQMASIIDIDLCDGCQNFAAPKCVMACKSKNQANFPNPKEPMMDYWPQKKHEDFSKQKDNISRLSPYNYTYVEKLQVANKEIYIPRRCMHCDNPPCQKVCPFGIISKSDEGAVIIDKDFCFGGAKCRNTCPWGVPQRQAGVGLYLKIAPKFAGGGVMYKCDMCADLLAKNQIPSCQSACPKNAIKFGKKDEILAQIQSEKRYIYGKDENGGTSTFYVSSVNFSEIDKAIVKKYGAKKQGIMRMNTVDNPMKKSENLAIATLIAPLAGISAGVISYIKSKKEKHDNH